MFGIRVGFRSQDQKQKTWIRCCLKRLATITLRPCSDANMDEGTLYRMESILGSSFVLQIGHGISTHERSMVDAFLVSLSNGSESSADIWTPSIIRVRAI